MVNLMLNSNWCEVQGDAPRFYQMNGPITCDDYSYAGNRSCSVTLPEGEQAFCNYLLPVDVTGWSAIRYGFLLRAIFAESVQLIVDFSDGDDHLLLRVEHDIVDRVTARFSRPWIYFAIPKGANWARFSIRFSGVVTACTFLAPFAYFCD